MVFHFQKMNATNLDGDDEEEEYIDMELSTTSLASPQSREFEFQFQMPTTSNHTHTTTSPADELFYEGKLLPLYLPPRPPTTATATSTSTTAASESCRVSCELNPDVDDCFFEWSNELNSFINNVNANNHHPTKITWAKKLKLIKHTILGHRNLKGYLKSLFVKSACSSSHDSSAKTRHPTIAAIMSCSIEKDNPLEENSSNNIVQRRSFSSAIKRHSPTKCLSSSTSSTSNSSSGSSSFSLNSNELHCLRRSSSATEIEGSIEAAIAHCKNSQQLFQSGI